MTTPATRARCPEITTVHLRCGHVVERLECGADGTFVRCPWCREPQLVTWIRLGECSPRTTTTTASAAAG